MLDLLYIYNARYCVFFPIYLSLSLYIWDNTFNNFIKIKNVILTCFTFSFSVKQMLRVTALQIHHSQLQGESE